MKTKKIRGLDSRRVILALGISLVFIIFFVAAHNINNFDNFETTIPIPLPKYNPAWDCDDCPEFKEEGAEIASVQFSETVWCACEPSTEATGTKGNICEGSHGAAFIVRLDKKKYCPGETIMVTARGRTSDNSTSNCYGQLTETPPPGKLFGRINDSVKLIMTVKSEPYDSAWSSPEYAYFKAESIPGDYEISASPTAYSAFFLAGINLHSYDDNLELFKCGHNGRYIKAAETYEKYNPGYCFPKITYEVIDDENCEGSNNINASLDNDDNAKSDSLVSAASSKSTPSSSSTATSVSSLSSSVRSAYPSFSLSDVSETEKSYLSGSSSAGNDINGDGKFTYADVISLVQCWNNAACRGED